MKKLTAEDLLNLKYGDTVYRYTRSDNEIRKLRFVGLMPSCQRYLIFENGEYLTHLYISEKDNSFKGDWYYGTYDSKFIGDLKIKRLLERIESVKKIYLSEE